MTTVTTQNYRVELFLNSLRSLLAQKGLGYTNLLNIARLQKKMEALMLPYFEIRKELGVKYGIKDENGKDIIDPTKADLANKEFEEVALANVDFELESPLVLNLKDDSFLDLNLVKAFTDVIGEDNFKVVLPE